VAEITVLPEVPPSTVTTIDAADAGDKYRNEGDARVFLFNDAALSIDVTRLAQRQPPLPLDCDDDVVACAPGLTILPPVSPRYFNDALGFVQLRYPAGQAVNLRLAARRYPRAL